MRKKNLKPLGSDISIKIEELEDLEEFFRKEKVLIENKEREIYKNKETVENMNIELEQRIKELEHATKVNYHLVSIIIGSTIK